MKPITAPPELINPDYVIYQYRPDCWKVIRNASTAPRMGIKRSSDDGFKYDDKLPQALSRARKVCLELALCNDWKWFATFTIAKNNYDRSNLDGFYERFNGWLRKQRMEHGLKIPYVLVPEQHGDGSWHLHGFFNSDMDSMLVSFKKLDEEGYRSAEGKRLPLKLINGDYYDWPAYRERFGYCSFGRIRNHDAAAFYVVKYISKSFQGDAKRVGLKLYYCSQGLNRAEKLDEVYGPCPPLDSCLTNHYQHCSTGFLFIPHELGDQPMLDLLEQYTYHMQPITITPELFPDVDAYVEACEQLTYM